jgi:hypothetical protein
MTGGIISVTPEIFFTPSGLCATRTGWSDQLRETGDGILS